MLRSVRSACGARHYGEPSVRSSTFGVDCGEGISAYLEARNVLNERYIASASIAETANSASMLFEPGSGFAVYGGLRYRM